MGVLTQAFTAERDTEKYGITLVDVPNTEGKTNFTPDANRAVVRADKAGESFSVIYMHDFNHSTPVLFSRDDEGLYGAIWMDSANQDVEFNEATDLDNVFCCCVGQTSVDLKMASTMMRQVDEVSCHTDALVMLKDMLREMPDFALTALNAESTLPQAMLSAAQSNNFLEAKSLQKIEATVDWLVDQSDPEQAAKELLARHFPQHDVRASPYDAAYIDDDDCSLNSLLPFATDDEFETELVDSGDNPDAPFAPAQKPDRR